MERDEQYICILILTVCFLSLGVIWKVLFYSSWINKEQTLWQSVLIWLSWWVTTIISAVFILGLEIPNPLSNTRFSIFGIMPIIVYTTTAVIVGGLKFIKWHSQSQILSLSNQSILEIPKFIGVWQLAFRISLITCLFVFGFLIFGNYLIEKSFFKFVESDYFHKKWEERECSL